MATKNTMKNIATDDAVLAAFGSLLVATTVAAAKELLRDR